MREQVKFNPHDNPIDFYNQNHKVEAAKIILDHFDNVVNTNGELHEMSGDDVVATIRFRNNHFITEDISAIIPAETPFSPFQILCKYKFKNNYVSAMNYVQERLMKEGIKYIRVGVNYFKKVTTLDRFGIERSEISRWNKEEIKEDYGTEAKNFLARIPRFDGFTLVPSNTNYQSVVHGHYNMYSKFSHRPKKGDWTWTERLLRHVFGEQYDMGIKYMQSLYLHPKQALPILVLSSKERATGKSTFVNWINQIFGANSTIVSPQDIESSFNGSYSTSNIISIEETSSDKKHLVEKLKDLSTKKLINVNKKFIDQYDIPFYGHFIITTNDTDKFLIVDSEEIRFWVRVLGIPEFFNTAIEDKLVDEIPAFLHYLHTLPDLDFSKSRMLFTAKELRTAQLDIVKENSRSWLYKEICENLEMYFLDNRGLDHILVHPSDIKNKYFEHDKRVEVNYIRRVLKNEFNLNTEEPMSYTPWLNTEPHHSAKIGRPFKIERRFFFSEADDEKFDNVNVNIS